MDLSIPILISNKPIFNPKHFSLNLIPGHHALADVLAQVARGAPGGAADGEHARAGGEVVRRAHGAAALQHAAEHVVAAAGARRLRLLPVNLHRELLQSVGRLVVTPLPLWPPGEC